MTASSVIALALDLYGRGHTYLEIGKAIRLLQVGEEGDESWDRDNVRRGQRWVCEGLQGYGFLDPCYPKDDAPLRAAVRFALQVVPLVQSSLRRRYASRNRALNETIHEIRHITESRKEHERRPRSARR